MIRKLLIAVGVLLGLLVVLAIGVSFVDVNAFKPQITSYVSSNYQRTLTINGDLSLSVFPRAAVTLPDVRLSEPGKPEVDAARLKAARVSVALMPLLKGEIQADTISIEGLDAQVVRNKDGSLSIDDLIGAAPAGEEAAGGPDKPAEAPAPEAGGGVPSFRINGVELRNARVVYDDRQAGQRLTFDHLDLVTGPLANEIETPLDLKMGFSASNPEARGEFGLKGRLKLNLNAGLYGFNDFHATLKGAIDTLQIQQLALRLKSLSFNPDGPQLDLNSLLIEGQGRVGEDSFQTRLAAPRLAIAKDSASGETIEGMIKLGDKEWLNASLSLAGVGGNADALKVERLGLETVLRQEGRGVVARLVTPVMASLAGGSYQLTALDGTVSIDDPSLPKAASELTLGGKVALDLNKENASADLSALIDGGKMVLKAAVNGFERPKINVALDADKLNIDHFFPPAKEDAAALPPGGAPGNAAETPVDLSALGKLTLDARLGIGHLVARGLEARAVKATARIANGQLDLAPVSASLYEGRLNASSVVSTGSSPAANKIALKADLAGIAIEPLLKALADQDVLEGKGNVSVAVNTGGGSVEALKRALAGKASMKLADGALKGINLGAKMRQARDMFKAGQVEKQASDTSQKTDFTEMSVSFQIQNGVARSNDLSMKSPLLRVGGEGAIDIGRSVLDYTVMASVVGTSGGQSGKELAELRGVTIPVRLTGPFDAPAWQIDWAAAGREALKSKLGNELKERGSQKLKESLDKHGLGDKLDGAFDKDKAQETLKGLFGR